MSSTREIKQLQKAKSKAQSSNNLGEEANICNQLGELLSRSGDYEAAIREHQQELSFSEVLNDVIGRAVANRKIGECYAEMGNIEAALKVSRLVCFIQKGFLWATCRLICKRSVDIKKAFQASYVYFFFSTSDVTWTWLALSEIMPRSKGHSPRLVEPTSSVMNRTNRGTVWSKQRMPSGRAWPL
ncbi:Tonsoku-like protein [Liparis tanakae]|uniref:Tonsoku-like protein n=1 Tax=Liparis tanakae TaxID=230148 RepID=A0A4Z2GQE3_9TELE|nr:Tonsoku-like protein [Liparis tanakae]